MFGSILVSFCQLWFCFEAIDGSTASRLQKMAHAVATLTTNTAMAVLPASSTMVVKMLEPLTTAALKRFTQGVSVPTFTLVSLPLIVTGVTLFVGNPFETMLYTNSLLLVLTSNICFGIRNITSSMNHDNNQQISLKRFRFSWRLVAFAAVTSVTFYSNPHLFFPVTYVVISGLFHVIYSYVSVALVLKSVSVVTHAVLNILKRVFVVLLLCVFGSKVISVDNLIGLIIACFGLFIYAYGKSSNSK